MNSDFMTEKAISLPLKKRGRPSSYHLEYAQLAYNYCLLGGTDADLADFFDVSEQTVNTWKLKHKDFNQALKNGKLIADAKVAEALFKRATGYSHPETHVSNFQGDITLTEITKHYPADTGAAFIWLRNRQPKLWKQKIEQEVTVDVRMIPWDEMRLISAKAIEVAEEKHKEIIEGRAERLGLKIEYTNDLGGVKTDCTG